MSILVVAQHNNQQINEATANSLTAAYEIAEKAGCSIHVLVAGFNCAEVANEASQIPNIASVLLVDDAVLEHQMPEDIAALLVKTVNDKGITHLITSATTVGKSLLPRVAALLDTAQISDISAVIDANTFIRPIYAGNALATIQSADAIKVITVRTASFAASAMSGSDACAITNLEAPTSAGLSRFISEEVTQSERPELTSARIIVSGGRGMGSGENFAIIESLADKIGAAVGASRAAVDSGFVSNDKQVGQTGKIVSPDLYVAVGISGAIQHLAGMKESKVIVAINKDKEAPIFNVADYGLEADLFEAIPALEKALS